MTKPLPKSQLDINAAVKQIIAVEFPDRYQYIKHRSVLEVGAQAHEITNKELSLELSRLIFDIQNDARALLRQWLRDGRIRSFHSDPWCGDVELNPSVWGLAITDSAIKGGEYIPNGDPTFSGPIGLHYADFLRIVMLGEELYPAITSSNYIESVRFDNLQSTNQTKDEDNQDYQINTARSPNFIDEFITKPTGKDRKREGVEMALRAIYGPGMGRGLSYKVRLNSVRQWYKEQGWEVPSISQRTFDRVLNPDKNT